MTPDCSGIVFTIRDSYQDRRPLFGFISQLSPNNVSRCKWAQDTGNSPRVANLRAPTDQQSRLHGGGSGKESHGSKYEGVNSVSYLSMSYIVPIVYLFSAIRRAELRRATQSRAGERKRGIDGVHTVARLRMSCTIGLTWTQGEPLAESVGKGKLQKPPKS